MIRRVWCVLAISTVMFGSVRASMAQVYPDPAPPKVSPLPEIPVPQPQAQKELHFHTAPKPLATGAVTHDWRSFLGPTHNAVSTESPLLKRFAKDQPTLLWEVKKGDGYSSPAVIGDRVILFHRAEDTEAVECLQAETGKRFWKVSYPSTYEDRYGQGNGPRCQPISDGQSVYTLGVEGKLYCIKLTTGQVQWKRDLVTEFKLKKDFFGIGTTPLLHGDLLIINIGAEPALCVVALNKSTGKLVWGAGKEWGASYSSPIPATVNGKERIFVFAGGESQPATGGLLSIDPTNGKVDFQFPWRARRFESVNASCPVIVGNQVYISECYGRGGTLLDILPDGSYKQVWSNQSLGTHFMTSVVKDGYIYGVDGHGPRNNPIVCIELKTGKEMWRAEPEWEQTLKTSAGERKFSLGPGLASMLLVDGRCLMLGEFGQLFWLDLNPKEYRETERAHLFLAGATWSMPVLSRGLLYICQNSQGADDSSPRLLCYDLRGDGK